MSSAPRRSSAIAPGAERINRQPSSGLLTVGATAGPVLKDYLHKTVDFRFEGHTLRLALSQSLFSSYDVDSGSRLLLASVVRELAAHPDERRRLRSILDLGCGTGVLGLALAKRFAAVLTARDRDALALAVTAHNAAVNGVACTTHGGVDTTNLDGRGESDLFQLVVSNLPAKAGAPVLQRLVAAAAHATTPGGRIAIVVVANLAEQTRRQLAAVAEVIHSHRGNRHTVFHARPRPATAPGATDGDPLTAALAPYERHRGTVTLAGESLSLTTRYGLPDFDTPSHLTTLAAAAMHRNRIPAPASEPQGRDAHPAILVWNPGQGHLPVWLARMYGVTAREGGHPRFTLVSRDALQLLATRANLRRTGVPDTALELHHRVALPQLARRHDPALLNPDEDLPQPARDRLFAHAEPLLHPGGSLVVYGAAPAIAPLLARRRPFTMIRESRRRALRVAILRAPPASAAVPG